jgi:methionine synthase II (cobalamin-independent)
MPTGVGSVPFLDVDATCRNILTLFPDIPFWPQFVKRSPFEDMTTQASQGLPFIKRNQEKNSLYINASDAMENELTDFYEHFMGEDIDYFSVSPEYAAGLYKLLEFIDTSPQSYGPFIKGQIVGPITFAGSLIDGRGKSALYNNEIMDTIVKGLAIKALWIAKKLSSSDKRAIIFIDEPYLSGFGSAFTPIQREEVIRLLKEVIVYLKSRTDILIGIHCCGNTDWSMIMETGIDIVNFDAFDYMDYFLLYRREIIKFLENSGTVAWGIVPTTSFTGKETMSSLKMQLEKGLNQFYEWGIDQRTVAERSILTPACGVGSIEADKAQRILELLSGLSRIMSDQTGSSK